MTTPDLIVTAARLLGAAGNAVAVRAGRIDEVGESQRLLRRRGPGTRVVAAPGGVICAGFHDAHVHLVLAGAARTELSLRGMDAGAIVEAVRAAAADRAPGRWVVGNGFDPLRFPGAGATARALLDAVAPHHPVLLRPHDYHAAALNSAALERTGFLPTAPNPAGGHVGRDDSGAPSGMLHENAAVRAEEHAGDATPEELEAATAGLLGDLVRAGLTAVHDMSGSRHLDVLERLARAERLPLDCIATVSCDDLDRERRTGRLRVGGMKAFLDGALGTRTAHLLAPYEDDPAHSGIPVLSPDETRRVVRAAAAAGLPSCLHAIGDAAVRLALDATQGVVARDGSRLRHRVEHAQMVHDDDVARFARQGVVASVQPVHIAEDAAPAHRHWGRRAREAFPLRRLVAAGAPLAFGSDHPIETFDVLDGVRCAVRREGRDGTELNRDEALTVEEALTAYTTGAAWAASLERECGALRPGLRAALTVLTHDVLTNADALDDCSVHATVIDGHVAHERRP